MRRRGRSWRVVAATGLALSVYAALGVYSVESDESAVAFLLGQAVGRDVLPGIHWSPPWPFGEVVVEKTATNFVMPLGYRMQAGRGAPIPDLWLTGDTNIVRARLNVQYNIDSVTRYLTVHERPAELVRRAGERALLKFLLSEPVDGILGGRRAALRQSVAGGVQELLRAEGVGISVQSVTVEELAPPEEGGVRRAFQGVQDARSDRERTVLEARAYRRQTLAEAEAEAGRWVSEARAARHRRIEVARGEAARFEALAREHARAPRVTERRLYLETLERILPGLEVYVVAPREGGDVNLRVVR